MESESLTARQAEVVQLNQKKDQIQKSKEGLNNTLKNIKTRSANSGLEVEDADSAGTPCRPTGALFFVAALAAVSKHSTSKTLERADPGGHEAVRRKVESRRYRQVVPTVDR
ncbi:MAG: hypothetical protein MZV70_21050 [Desulfobacterales bacterium]|nr:hypothetical protein [Desulfobacterales bacterium]